MSIIEAARAAKQARDRLQEEADIKALVEGVRRVLGPAFATVQCVIQPVDSPDKNIAVVEDGEGGCIEFAYRRGKIVVHEWNDDAGDESYGLIWTEVNCLADLAGMLFSEPDAPEEVAA